MRSIHEMAASIVPLKLFNIQKDLKLGLTFVFSSRFQKLRTNVITTVVVSHERNIEYISEAVSSGRVVDQCLTHDQCASIGRILCVF